MVFVQWKLEHTPFRDGDYVTGETADITDFFDPILEANLGDGRDMFKFKVQNNRGIYDDYFHIKDKVTVYRKVNSSSFTSDDIVMVAAIEKIPYKDSYNQNVLNIDCYNYSEAVMGAITFTDATTLKTDEAIQAALNVVSNFAPKFSVTWHPSNPTTTSTGDPFPVVGERFFYQTLLKTLEKLSQDKYTGDGRYFWYVDNENYLVWKKDSDYSIDTFDTTVDAYRELSTKIDSSKIINYIIVKGGYLPNGNQVQWYVPDFASIAKNGYKYHIMVSENNTAEELVKDDIADENNTDAYPDLTTSFETTWLWNKASATVEGVSCVEGSKVTINLGSEAANKAAYNVILKEVVIERIKKEALEILEVQSNGKFIIELDLLPGQKNWGLGTVVTVNVPQLGLTAKQLRVQEFQLTTDGDLYELEEDTGSV